MAEEQNSIKSQKILLVDDDVQLVELFAKYIQDSELQVEKMFSSEQVVERVRQGDIDIVLLDVMMPGKDGFTVLKELKADPDTNKIPVIMLTNMGEMTNIERGLQNGAADYAVKINMNPEKMKKLLQKHLITHDARFHN